MSASTFGSVCICETSPTAMAPARVLTWAEIKEKTIVAVPWRVLEDSTELKAPRHIGCEDQPLLLNFTEDDDAWLRAEPGFDYVGQLKKHHNAIETVACKVLLKLPEKLAKDVSELDNRIMRVAMNHGDMVSSKTGFNWMPMMRTETTMMASIVLEGSDAPTKLCFIGNDGSVQQGVGLEFFKAQLGDSKIEDFSCKVWAEMQFIDVQKEMQRKTVTVKVHSLALAKTPKEEVVSFTQDHIDSFVRAAKRIRVNRL